MMERRKEQPEEKVVNGRTFVQFMDAVDNEIVAQTGLTSTDIADFTYMDAFLDESDPEDVAMEALAAEGWDEFEDV